MNLMRSVIAMILLVSFVVLPVAAEEKKGMMGGGMGMMMGEGMMMGGMTQTEFSSNGERIYYAGINEKGEIIKNSLGMQGVGCGMCHGVGAKGMFMMGMEMPDLRWSTLIDPKGHTHPSGRSHSPFIEPSFKTSVLASVDPAGNQLSPMMPRWQISNEDMDDLIDYLKSLSGMMGEGMGGMMGGAMMGGGREGMMGGGMMMGLGSSPWFHHGVTLTLQNADKLGIDEKQKGQLEEIRTRYTKDIIRHEAELRIAEMELDTLLGEKTIDLPKVKEAVRKVAGVEAQIRYLRVEAFTEARKVLTDEQRKRLKELMEMPSTPMKMEMMERPMMKGGMGEGMGKMGGMDCPMMKGMQGMMGGGMMMGRGMMGGGMMSGQAKAEGPMTQEKTAGAVTVNTTFKNPDAIGDKEELVFNLKLDTHTVNLDMFDFKEGIILKDDMGKTYKPTSAEPTGAGHHRSAVLRFTNPGKVKSLELIVKDLAGVKETVFRWEFSGMKGM